MMYQVQSGCIMMYQVQSAEANCVGKTGTLFVQVLLTKTPCMVNINVQGHCIYAVH